MASRLCYWFKNLGIKSIYIFPDLNYGAAIHADKWIPIRPNTDAALQLAIAYIWMTEETYDKEYVATHTFGYEKYEGQLTWEISLCYCSMIKRNLSGPMTSAISGGNRLSPDRHIAAIAGLSQGCFLGRALRPGSQAGKADHYPGNPQETGQTYFSVQGQGCVYTQCQTPPL